MAKAASDLTPKARRTRSALLDAARDVIGSKGVEGISVMNVCDAAAVGRTSFYNYFDDATQLVEAVAAEAAQAIKADFDALHSGQPRGLPRLEACLKMILDFAVNDRETALLLTSLAASSRHIPDLLMHEIDQELAAHLLKLGGAEAALPHFLTYSVLMLCREIARERVSKEQIPSFVSLMMAACGASNRV